MIVPRTAIGWIVGRLHVSTSRAEVVRVLYRRLRKSDLPTTRAFRHACYREALRAHKANVDLFNHYRF